VIGGHAGTTRTDLPAALNGATVEPDDRPVSIGASLFLIAVGAILYFAVTAELAGIEIQTVGLILMIIGVLGFVVTLFLLGRARREGRGPGA
jgi:hypothetical protein